MTAVTANVVLGFNKDIMDRLFIQGATYTSLVQGLTVSGTDNALLFSNESNPNFISFEHSLNVGGGMKMRLQFIDPKQEFEERFFTDNYLRAIAGYDSNATEVGSFLTHRENAGVKFSLKDYNEVFIDEFKKEYKKFIGEKVIYVAYGVGENLDYWSGPHRTILTNADIDVKGSRKITLEMTPTPTSLVLSNRRGAYNEQVNLNLAGLTMRCSGDSQLVEFNNILSGLPVYDPIKYLKLGGDAQEKVTDFRDENRTALGTFGYEALVRNLASVDYHSLIVDSLRNYVQKATNNPNVIILLPNLNVICRRAINETLKDFKADPSKSPIPPGQSVGSLAKNISAFLYSQALDQVSRQEQAVASLLDSFGMELQSIETQVLERNGEPLAFPFAQILQYASYEQAVSAEARFKKYYLDRNYYGILQASNSEGIPDHINTVGTLINKIKEKAKEDYQIQFVVFEETNTKILDFWAKGNKNINPSIYPIFGGYNKFRPDKEAIVVGDLALIKDYLYGIVELNQKFDSVLELKNKALKSALAEQSEAYTFAAINQIPLHPIDKTILTNNNYNAAIKDLVFPAFKGKAPFGDTSFIPDEFAYTDVEFSLEEEKFIRERGISVFRYNTENPNVSDMKFKFGPIYFANLKYGYSKLVERKASSVAEGLIPGGFGTFPIRTPGIAAAYILQKGYSLGLGSIEKQQLLLDLASRISPDLVAEMQLNSPIDTANAIAAILDEATKDNLKPIVEIAQHLPGNPHSILSDFAEDMYRKAMQLTVKTLPSFHLSNISTISSPCILFAQDVDISQAQRVNRSALNVFFSGLYKIMGFKHTISVTGVESEFKLIKNAPKIKQVEK